MCSRLNRLNRGPRSSENPKNAEVTHRRVARPRAHTLAPSSPAAIGASGRRPGRARAGTGTRCRCSHTATRRPGGTTAVSTLAGARRRLGRVEPGAVFAATARSARTRVATVVEPGGAVTR